MTMINDIKLTFNVQPAVGLVLLSILHKLHDLTAPSACSHHHQNDRPLQMTKPASSSSQVLKTRASFSPLSTRLIRPSAGKLNAVPFFNHLNLPCEIFNDGWSDQGIFPVFQPLALVTNFWHVLGTLTEDFFVHNVFNYESLDSWHIVHICMIWMLAWFLQGMVLSCSCGRSAWKEN